ncbi:hypothetical protein [Roseomonas sp. 18066]|uniref:hypothetical protein n=1 Tax=Roseomonas sp. 18066 TaxID=2681412 RepID=UPI001F2C9D70|nr:hypothetical protein [Roseomonas sp. 18066]
MDASLTRDVLDAAPADLGTLYAPPDPRILKNVKPELTPFHAEYLKLATFFVLATGR